MAHSMSSGGPYNKIRQDLKNGATVVCHMNNVFKVKADILVISQNGSVESCAREKVGAQEWDKKKQKATRYIDRYIDRDWKFVKISIIGSKPNFHFIEVYDVTVPVFNKINPEKWLDEYQKMMKNLLVEAESDGKSSITIPLLGTYAGGAPKDECVRRVMYAVFEFPKFKSLRKINVVVQDYTEFFLVEDLTVEHQKSQTSDEDKYKNITLMSSISNSTDNPAIHGRSQSPDKRNKFHSSSHDHTNGAGATSRGDNPDVRHRSSSHNSRTSWASRSNTLSENKDNYSLERQRETSSRPSKKPQPSSARDGGEIQKNSGFGISGSSAQKEDDVIGSRSTSGSSVDPSWFQYSTQQGTHSDGNGNVKKHDLNFPKNNNLHPGKDSYAKVVQKNNKVDSDHHHISNGDSSRSYGRDKDEEYSKEYAESHKKHNIDLDYRSYSRKKHNNGDFPRYDNLEDITKRNAELDQARLEELAESEQSEDPDNKVMSSDKMIKSSNNREELESTRHHGNFDSKHKISYHNVKDTEGKILGLSETEALRDVSLHHSSYCNYNNTSRVELPCCHVFCIFYAPTNLGCPQCEISDKKFNKKEDSYNPSNRVQTSFLQHHCKSCLGYTYCKLKELPCHHVCCFHCLFDCQRSYNPKSCQQRIAERYNKREENSSEPVNRVQSSREKTHGEDLTHSSEKQHCKSNLGYQFSKVERYNKEEENISERVNRVQSSREKTHGEDPVHSSEKQHCKSNLDYQFSKVETSEPDDRVQSSREPIHGEGRDTPVEEKCDGCDSSLANKSSVNSACGCTLCAKCLPKGCNGSSCKKDHEDDRGQSSSKESFGEDPGYGGQSSSKESHGEDPSYGGQSASKESHGEDPSYRGQSSSNESHGEDPSYGGQSSSKESHGDDPSYRGQSASKESHGDDPSYRGQSASKESHGDDPSYRGQSSSKESHGEDPSYGGQSSSKESHGDDPSYRGQSASKESHGDDPSYRGQSASKESHGDDPSYRDSSELNPREVITKTALITCYRCDSNLANNSPVQLSCGHTFCAKCASKGCSDPNCEEEQYYDDDAMDPTGSELGQDSSDDHSNRGRNGSNGNHRDTRVDNHSNGRLSGSDSNYRDSRLDNHSNRELQESKVNDEKENRSREVHQPQKDAEKTEICAICMDDITDLKKLDKCGHVFCRKCIDKSFKLHKPVCPSCGTVYGVTIGNMPAGTMNVHKSSLNIEGYKRFGSYCISYDFNSGIQGSKHPNAGVRFKGTSRVAYLPANPEGIEVCKMLKVAFRRRLTFTIGRSTTTGQENVVTWNDIHHKTSMNGGPTNFGYPDATYLSRIKEELASKGVTLADIDGVKDGDESITVK